MIEWGKPPGGLSLPSETWDQEKLADLEVVTNVTATRHGPLTGAVVALGRWLMALEYRHDDHVGER